MSRSPDPLSSALQAWRHEPAATATFNAEVWARIHSAQHDQPTFGFYRWALPLAASLALVAGVSAGLYQADRRHDERMASALVRAVDPLQMSADHHHHGP